ncbi:hypothetical protein BH18ACT5_BH18ACT5_17950 [soil metagenome]
MTGDVLGIAYRPEGLMLVFAHQPALVGIGRDKANGTFNRRRTFHSEHSRELEKLIDRVARNRRRDLMGPASGVLGVPAVNSGFTRLVTGNERNVLLACPGPNRFVLVGSLESLDQVLGSFTKVGQEPCIVLGSLEVFDRIGRDQAIGDDGRPEVMHPAEMPDEIGNVPSRAFLDRCVPVAVDGNGERFGVAPNRFEIVPSSKHGCQTIAMTHVSKFHVKQRITMMVNRYEVRAANEDGTDGGLLALAQQKRMKFKEEVTFFADEARTQKLFSFKARHGLDVRAEHDVFDADGNAIGWFKKEFRTSLLRSTWQLSYAGVTTRGQERNQTIAILRRVWEFIPVVGDLWIPFLFHFDFVDQATGQQVMSSERKAAIRDRYVVHVPDSRLDFPVAASMAVALDALQSR